jgi:prevent-host-death family protein
MRTVSITEAKNRLSALIDSLESGSPVLIVDQGRPVARLERVAGRKKAGQEGRLTRLLHDGIARQRRTEPPRDLFCDQPPRAKAGVSAVDALIEERRGGR